MSTEQKSLRNYRSLDKDYISLLSLPVAEETRQTNCWSKFDLNFSQSDFTTNTNKCLLKLFAFHLDDFQTKRYLAQYSSINNTWISNIKSIESLNLSTSTQVCDYVLRLIDYPAVVSAFAFFVKSLGYIEKVIFKGKDGKFNIWTIVNNTNIDQRYAIYDRQWEVMQFFRNVQVEFNLIDREGIPLEKIITWDEDLVLIEG